MPSTIWFRTLSPEQRALLVASDPLSRTAEVTIVGAGMIGLATAYYLAQRGIIGISVLDRESALAEASGANAGGLWFGQQSPELGPLTGLAKTSSRLYDELAAEPGFDFDLRRHGLLELLYTETQMEQGARLAAAIRQAGFRAQCIEAAELRKLEPALGPGPLGALHCPDEGQLHPGKLGAAFVAHLKTRGVKFCFGAEVTAIAGRRVETSAGALETAAIVIASGAWTPLVTRTLGWTPPIKPMRGQLLATEPRPPTLRHTVMGQKYYYWQLREGHLAGGGTLEDVGFRRGTEERDIAEIRAEMDSIIPAAAATPTALAWSGFRPYCEDLLPVIGRVPGPERTYVAAGHFKKGIMLAPVTGRILSDLIVAGCTDLPIAPLDPARFPGAVA
jgi:glycine/D-amino acid oxidase-like deaminating enzyme